MADYDIGKAFRRIEEELISSMIRNLDHHKAMEDDAGIQWSQWQVEQLRALDEYRRANREKFSDQFADINKKVPHLIQQAREEGQMDQEIEILEAIEKGARLQKVTGNIAGEFFAVNDRKLNALIDATVGDFQKAEYAMLRMADDQYRKIIFDAEVYANAGGTTYEKAVDMATKDFLSKGINCIEYSNGSRHRIEDYAKMAIKTATTRAYLTGEGEVRREWNIPTVIVNKRNGACPKCAPFCGKVFIDDVWSGGSADGKSPETGKIYPKISTAIKAGLYHPNCRDIHTTYFEGISTPPGGFKKEELKKMEDDYAADQKQQYAERQAEKYRRLAKNSLDEENQKWYRGKADQWNNYGLRSSDNDYETNGWSEPELLKTIDFENTDVVKSILNYYEKIISKEEIENAIVITRIGEVYRCYGDLNGVYPDIDLGEKLRGAIVTHNHPIGSDNEFSFSNADIKLFREYELDILRGVDENYVYELNRNPKDIDEHISFEELIMSDGEHFRHEVVIEIAEENGFGYRRVKNEYS